MNRENAVEIYEESFVELKILYLISFVGGSARICLLWKVHDGKESMHLLPGYIFHHISSVGSYFYCWWDVYLCAGVSSKSAN